MQRTRTRSVLPVLVLAWLASACGNSNDEIQVALPPLSIDSTVPEDAAATPYVGSPALQVSFNRGASGYELRSWMAPALEGGSFVPTSVTGRSWTWDGVEFVEEDGCYFWLIDVIRLGYYTFLADGERVFVRKPGLVRIPSSADRHFNVGFAGQVTSLNPNVLASGAIVFALPLDSGFNYLEPGTFDASKAVGIATTARPDDFVDRPAFFTARFLPVDTGFQIVAIKDTNEDLHYSPLDDWWGAYLVDGEPETVFAKADTNEKDSEFNAAVDIYLQAPVPVPELPQE